MEGDFAIMPSDFQLELQFNLGRYVDGRISLDEFEDWFLPVLWNLGEHGEERDRQLAGSIGNLIAEATRGDRSVDSLHLELANAVRETASYTK